VTPRNVTRIHSVEVSRMAQPEATSEAANGRVDSIGVAIRVARRLAKTNSRNPIVSSQAIGPRMARVEKILKKYGVSAK
jgi:hypothetical protein